MFSNFLFNLKFYINLLKVTFKINLNEIYVVDMDIDRILKSYFCFVITTQCR